MYRPARKEHRGRSEDRHGDRHQDRHDDSHGKSHTSNGGFCGPKEVMQDRMDERKFLSDRRSKDEDFFKQLISNAHNEGRKEAAQKMEKERDMFRMRHEDRVKKN